VHRKSGKLRVPRLSLKVRLEVQLSLVEPLRVCDGVDSRGIEPHLGYKFVVDRSGQSARIGSF
jgi:hypothetical protein